MKQLHWIRKAHRIGKAACGALFAVALAVGASSASSAQDLRVGLATITTSPDPHFYDLGPNNGARQHVYEALFFRTHDMQFKPLLVESVKLENEVTWVVALRKGIRFHNGKELGAEDVAATLARVPKVTGSPSSYAPYITFLDRVEVRDKYTVAFITKGPYPNLPQYMAAIGIIPKEVADKGNDIRFDDPANAIGTGPYRFAEFVPNERLVLTRNDDYWGEKEPWARVTFRQITNAAGRTAALLAGDLDLIDNANVTDLKTIDESPNTAVARGPSFFVLFLQPYHAAQPIAGIGADGRNPLADRRVREAISLAVDRQAIIERILDGLGKPANQLVPPEFFGYSKDIPERKPDPARARALLAEAGYEKGFDLLLSSPQGRYLNDARVAQAVAQMLTRVGIRTNVETMPVSVLFARRNRSELALFLGGFGSNTGESSFALQAMVATRDTSMGMGRINFSFYSNKQADDLIRKAATDMNDASRSKSLQDAAKLSIGDDFSTIPLHQEFNVWGVRRTITYEARMDNDTLAMSARPQRK